MNKVRLFCASIVIKVLLMTGLNVTVVSSGSTVSVPETQKIGVQFFMMPCQI